MHELPSHFNQELPDHMARLLNGTYSDIPCKGRTVRNITEDVGEFDGICNRCTEEFVYLFKTDQWVTNAQFDTLLRDQSPTLEEALKHL